MAESITDERMAAGREYISALKTLGLVAEFAAWAIEDHQQPGGGHPVLLLVTDFFDFAGPLRVQEHLFRAYRAAATPREIDPFIVRLHSPKQRIFVDHRMLLDRPRRVRDALSPDGSAPYPEFISEADALISITIEDLLVHPDWVLKFYTPVPEMSVRQRRWKRFDEMVTGLAA